MRPWLPAQWLALLWALSMLSAPVDAATLAAPFSVRTLEGRSVRLSDFKGRPVVLEFWATWCSPCRRTMPQLDQMSERFRDRGLVVIGLSVDDIPSSSVRKYADRLGVRFPLAMANQDVLDDYGPIRTLPTTFYLNRRGQIVRRVVGYVDPETMESFVLEIVGK